MSNSFSNLHNHLLQLTDPILESLDQTHYTPPDSTAISPKAILKSLLPNKTSQRNPNITDHQVRTSIKDFTLACALLSASQSSTPELLSWIPRHLSAAVESAFKEISIGYLRVFGERNAERMAEFGVDCSGSVSDDKRLIVELMPEVLPVLKDMIKESSIDRSSEADEISAASARAPVGNAILGAYQFRWFVAQIDHPRFGKLCNLVIPCGLTALDHWSPEVKGQGMISFTHLAKNVTAAELSFYGDVILDACCQNIASSDDIWLHVVEMTVLLVTSIQRNNPRSSWFEKIMNEMLSHLERQPRDKQRRISWLRFIEPFFNAIGLMLLVHFRRIFPLFFQWMHADDEETILLVLKRLQTVIRLTWIRNSPFFTRLVDELVVLYKEAALKKAREEIRTNILHMLLLLQQCKGQQFEAAWDKHQEDSKLSGLCSSLSASTDVHAQTQSSFTESGHQRGLQAEPVTTQ